MISPTAFKSARCIDRGAVFALGRALAVPMLSPVTMRTVMCARLQSSMACEDRHTEPPRIAGLISAPLLSSCPSPPILVTNIHMVLLMF